VKALFDQYSISVGKIRMKHDGHKVFAFAETTNMELVDQAIKAMDGKEIEGRRLRVRGSKSTDALKREAERKEDRRKRDEDRKRREARKPRPADSKKHLVTAFCAFLDRELSKAGESATEEFKGLLEGAKSALTTAFTLPEDNTFKVDREIEDIFFKAVRLDIKVPEPSTPVAASPDEPENAMDEDSKEDAIAAAAPVQAEKPADAEKPANAAASNEVTEKAATDKVAVIDAAAAMETAADSSMDDASVAAAEEALAAAADEEEEEFVDTELAGDEAEAAGEELADDEDNMMEDLENALADEEDLLAEDPEKVPEPEPVKSAPVVKPSTPSRGRRGARGGRRARN